MSDFFFFIFCLGMTTGFSLACSLWVFTRVFHDEWKRWREK